MLLVGWRVVVPLALLALAACSAPVGVTIAPRRLTGLLRELDRPARTLQLLDGGRRTRIRWNESTRFQRGERTITPDELVIGEGLLVVCEPARKGLARLVAGYAAAAAAAAAADGAAKTEEDIP